MMLDIYHLVSAEERDSDEIFHPGVLGKVVSLLFRPKGRPSFLGRSLEPESLRSPFANYGNTGKSASVSPCI